MPSLSFARGASGTPMSIARPPSHPAQPRHSRNLVAPPVVLADLESFLHHGNYHRDRSLNLYYCHGIPKRLHIRNLHHH